jgi:hypothetical protein
MDYALHYDRLIARAKNRVLSSYVERHHVLPRCLGGSDDPSNIVRLTGEEHFVAHQLLVKMHPGHLGLVWALSAMCSGSGRQDRTNKRYGWLRRKLASSLRMRFAGKPLSAEHRAKLSTAAKLRAPRRHSAETRASISAARKGAMFSAEHRAKLAAAKIGNRNRAKRTEA